MRSAPIFDAILWLLASPVLGIQLVMRAIRHARFLNMATTPSIECRCQERLWLVGIWKCSCGFTYRGHLLTVCPVCQSLPCIVRCYTCDVTTKLPEPYKS